MTAKTIDKRMTKARSGLVIHQPFFGTLALQLQIEEDETIDTMGTDGTTIAYSPKFLDELNEVETMAVIAHEVMHCAYRHHTRRGSRDPDMWNEAADYVINLDLVKAGFVLPKCGLLDQKFAGLSTEEVYAYLDQQKKKEPKKAGSGSGKSGAPGKDPGRCGTVRDAAPEHSPAAIAEQDAKWEMNVRQALNIQARAGSMHGALDRLIETTKNPRVDWREILRRFIDDRNRADYAWTSPNKRMLGYGFVMPGVVADGLNHLGIVIDTSGSISRDALAQFAGELQAAIDEGAADQITVIYCDTRVQRVEQYRGGDILKLNAAGGGGTRFAPALDWFEKNEPDTSALIYFTDLECGDYGREPVCPLLWAAYGDPVTLKHYAAQVPFGEIIELI